MGRYDELRDVLKGNVSMPGWKPSQNSVGRMRRYPSGLDARDDWLYKRGAHTAQGFSEEQQGIDIMKQRAVEHGLYADIDEVEAEWEGSYYEMGEHYGGLPDPERRTVQPKEQGWIRGWEEVEDETPRNIRGPDLDRWEDRIASAYVPTGIQPTDLQGARFEVGTSSSPLSVGIRGRGASFDNSTIRARAASITTPTMSHELGHFASEHTPTGRTERRRSLDASLGDTRTGPEEEAFADEFMGQMVPGVDESHSYRGGSEYRRSAEWRDRYEAARSNVGGQFDDLMHEFRSRGR